MLLLGLMAVGCGDDVVGPSEEITGLPRELSVAEQALIAADNTFGLKLFRAIRATQTANDNIFISPLSVAMALGMTYNGAAGTTQQAMQEALELQGLSIDDVNESYRGVIDLLADLDPSVEFLLANSIWYREGFQVEAGFLDVNRTYFDAEVRALDFSSANAAPTINGWVDQKTRGRIDEIVAAPIPTDVVMYLINAIYFKGSWTSRFDKDLTTRAPFTLADGSQKNVDMMSTGEEIPVNAYLGSDLMVLDLPYGGKAYSMTIVLPNAGVAIGDVVASLDDARWGTWIDGLVEGGYVVVMPKFTLRYELEMKDVLSGLGMGIAFQPLAADFTKINPTPGLLYISKVKHKTFVDVNEEGTEAAAVTSVEVRETSIPPTLYVDRPFLFAIRERFSGTVLFLGLIMDPEGASGA